MVEHVLRHFLKFRGVSDTDKEQGRVSLLAHPDHLIINTKVRIRQQFSTRHGRKERRDNRKDNESRVFSSVKYQNKNLKPHDA